jgi:hypothetical protein
VYLQEAGYLLVKTSLGAGYAGWSFDVPIQAQVENWGLVLVS